MSPIAVCWGCDWRPTIRWGWSGLLPTFWSTTLSLSSPLRCESSLLQKTNKDKKQIVNFSEKSISIAGSCRINMEIWACIAACLWLSPPLWLFALFKRVARHEALETLFECCSLRKRAIQLPDPTHTHTHLYIYLGSLSLYKIPGASCCVCPVYSSVQLPYKYNVYSIRPDSLTFFRPTSLYSSDSIQHHPPLFFIHFFSSPLGFCIFWLGRRRLNYFTKEISFLPAKKKIWNQNREGIPRHFQLRWKFFLLFRHGQTHTHRERKEAKYIFI